MTVQYTSTFPRIVPAEGATLSVLFADDNFDPLLLTTNIQDKLDAADYTETDWVVDSANSRLYTKIIAYTGSNTTAVHNVRVLYDNQSEGSTHLYRVEDPIITVTVDGVRSDAVGPDGFVVDTNPSFDVILTGATDLPDDVSEFTVAITDGKGAASEATAVGSYDTARSMYMWRLALPSDGDYMVTVTYHHVSATFNIKQATPSITVTPETLGTTDFDVELGVTISNVPTRVDATQITVSDDADATITSTASLTDGIGTISFTLPDDTVAGTYPTTITIGDPAGQHIEETFDVVFEVIMLHEQPEATFANGVYTFVLMSSANVSNPSTISVASDQSGVISRIRKREGGEQDTYTFTYRPYTPGTATLTASVDGIVGWTKTVGYWPEFTKTTDTEFNPRLVLLSQSVAYADSTPVTGYYQSGRAFINLTKTLTSNDNVKVQLSISPPEDLTDGGGDWATFATLALADFTDNKAIVSVDRPFTGMRIKTDYTSPSDYTGLNYRWRFMGALN